MWEACACILDGRNGSHPLNFWVDPVVASRLVVRTCVSALASDFWGAGDDVLVEATIDRCSDSLCGLGYPVCSCMLRLP
jgi:hypothetical protein